MPASRSSYQQGVGARGLRGPAVVMGAASVHAEGMTMVRVPLLLLLTASCALGQTTGDPFPGPIVSDRDAITVGYVEFASLPDVDGGAARMMHLQVEPGGSRLFVSDMRGLLYTVSARGESVALYLDLDATPWGVQVEPSGSERGFQSMALHPQFNEAGAPGFGKLYTLVDTRNMRPAPDFTPPGTDDRTHDTVLLEWTARTPSAAAYDGGRPRELMRFQQPYRNHNGGDLRFNPLASSGDPDFGLLYVGMADGGSGGDPHDLAQNLQAGFGKILRIDPLGSNGANGRYGIPAANPFVARGAEALGEIYAYGVRNPQRFAWDAETGNMFFAEIGQNTVEEVSRVTAGANLGWHDWEGSFVYVGRNGVNPEGPRADPAMIYPVVEYDQADALLQRSAAATMCCVYRHAAIPELDGLLLFGDNPSGEIFYVDADELPDGGQASIRRILFEAGGTAKTLLELIRAKNVEQGKSPASRADLRFDMTPDGRLFVLNKGDGTIRRIVSASR